MRTPSVSLLLLACCFAGCVACDKKDTDQESTETSNSEEKSAGDLPQPDFSVTPDIEGALFTWVDQDGSFRITDQPRDIPAHARKTVRVVVEGHSPGSAEYVYAVDLSKIEQGGELPVRTISRTEWEVLGKSQRDQRVAKLTPPDEPKDPSPTDLGVDAIVYGADWCKPCHLAENYLKKKGARVVKKDIEEDPTAAAEMRRKLKRAGMSGSSIPILDVGGTILKGFSERAVDAALKRAAP